MNNMLSISDLNKLSLNNFVYNNKEKCICQVCGINSDGIITWWHDNKNIYYDKKYHRDYDLIPITIENIQKLLFIEMELDNEPFDKDIKDWYDKYLHVLRLRETNLCVNRPNDGENKVWYVHVDNLCYDTIGSGDLIYINELQNLVRSIGFDIDSFYRTSSENKEYDSKTTNK